jgi:hypothetical protein
MNQHRDNSPQVTVEEWDEAESGIIETLARCSNILVARGAFDAAVKLRPRSRILLRDGARVIERHDGRPSPPPLRVV